MFGLDPNMFKSLVVPGVPAVTLKHLCRIFRRPGAGTRKPKMRALFLHAPLSLADILPAVGRARLRSGA